jgi:vitamin B12 transporter
MRKTEGFFVPAFLRPEKHAALACRITHRKQVTMKIIHRRRLGLLPTLGLVALYAVTLSPVASASDSTTSSTTATSKPVTPSGTAKTAPQGKTQATSASTKRSTTNSVQPQPAVAQLPTVVVTAATLNPQIPDTTATTTTVITHEDLDNAKYASVPDALQSVPGLSIFTTGMPGSQTSIFVHGLDSNQTLLTIDGRRQSEGLESSMDNLTNLTLDNIDQIEVVRTPISSVQGGGAMGGAVNLVTLSGKGLATPESSVSEEAGSFNTFRENVQSRGADGNFDYAVSASRQDSIYPALSTGTPGPFGSPGFTGQADQYRNSAYRGNFGYQVTPDVYIDLHTAYNNAYTSVTGPFAFPDPTANLLIEDWFLSPEVVARVTDFYSTKLYYTHDQQRQAYDDPYNAINFPGQGNITRTQINTDSVDWQNDFQIARNWSVTAGLQGDNRNYYQYDDDLGMDNFDGHNDNIGGYISSQWQPLTGLNLLNSVRYDKYSQFGGAFSWRQAATYTVADTHTVLHASVSRAYTPPPLQDLYLSFPAYGFFANPNLQPETDLGWEAGVEQPLWDDRVTPSVTYFHNDIKNDIGNVSIGGFNVMLENIEQATTDGVEVGLTVKPFSTVTAKIDYTYLNAVDDDTHMRLIRRPRNSLNFTGTWNPISPLTFTMGGNWVVDRQDSVSGSQIEIPDYFVLRASASYQINDTVSIWIRGENLTDRNYQSVEGYYAPSIAGYGGIKISF